MTAELSLDEFDITQVDVSPNGAERIADYDEPNVAATVVPVRRASSSDIRWLELQDKGKYYDGWRIQVVMNPPVSVVADVSSYNLDRMIQGLASLAKDWDYVDEEGDPVPCTLEGTKSLRADLVTASIRVWDKALALPKK